MLAELVCLLDGVVHGVQDRRAVGWGEVVPGGWDDAGPVAGHDDLPDALVDQVVVAVTQQHHLLHIGLPAEAPPGHVMGLAPVGCPVPGLMEALNPREDEGHGCTEEVPGGVA